MKKCIVAVSLLLLAAPAFGEAGIKTRGSWRDWSLNIRITNGTGQKIQGLLIKGARLYLGGKRYEDLHDTWIEPNQMMYLTGDRGKTYNKMIIKIGANTAAFGTFTNIGYGTALRAPTVELTILKQGNTFYVNNPKTGKADPMAWTITGDLSDPKKICY